MTSRAGLREKAVTGDPMSNGRSTNAREGQGGFTYLTALFLVAALGAGLAATGVVWSKARQREKEAELIWVGEQVRQAIGLYYQRSPGAMKRYPGKLEDLLEDRRYPNVQRYLRKIYADPVTGKRDWGLVLSSDGGVMGIRSLSTAQSIRERGNARTYADWKFVYEPPQGNTSTLPAEPRPK
jgi:type II secretory pathway pseudopilin PulG